MYFQLQTPITNTYTQCLITGVQTITLLQQLHVLLLQKIPMNMNSNIFPMCRNSMNVKMECRCNTAILP